MHWYWLIIQSDPLDTESCVILSAGPIPGCTLQQAPLTCRHPYYSKQLTVYQHKEPNYIISPNCTGASRKRICVTADLGPLRVSDGFGTSSLKPCTTYPSLGLQMQRNLRSSE